MAVLDKDSAQLRSAPAFFLGTGGPAALARALGRGGQVRPTMEAIEINSTALILALAGVGAFSALGWPELAGMESSHSPSKPFQLWVASNKDWLELKLH